MEDSDVDFVLVSEVENGKSIESVERDEYETNLKDEGCIFQTENVTIDSKQYRVTKIHVDYKAMCRYSETMKIKMPLRDKKFKVSTGKNDSKTLKRILNFFRLIAFYEFIKKYLTTKEIGPINEYLSTEFRCDRQNMFSDDGKNVVFPDATRIMVAHYILETTGYKNMNQEYVIGIDRLLEQRIYSAAYPQHKIFADKDLQKDLDEWANVSNFMKYQPFDTIKSYFGDKVALYFSWLGFYTNMLIYATFAGNFVFFYGLVTMPWNALSNDICNANETIMCPLCNRCKFWVLSSSCAKAKLTYLFDNNLTAFFGIFMSVWSTVYLKLWKRYSSTKVYEWGLIDVDHRIENPRPKYMKRLSNFKNKDKIPFWTNRLPNRILSYSMVVLMVMVVIIAVFSVILYRMSQKTVLTINSGKYTLAVPLSAGVLNLVLINVLNTVYGKVALVLTEMEGLRTQSEFDQSLSIKTYLFQIINYYSSIFYVAFLKGKFVGYPKQYITIMGFRQEECAPGGCFYELVIQLAIIMIGKQFASTLIEYFTPIFKRKFRGMKKIMTHLEEKVEDIPRWKKDYDLEPWTSIGLLDEYLEMVLQFGFVTLIVSAFPLAPLFALLNNCLKVRLDAKKFTEFFRRPVPARARNIGIWFALMDIIARLSVITNAFMIAFTSNFVPRMVYYFFLNKKHNFDGFLEHSLAYFNVSDFPKDQMPVDPIHPNITVCRYHGYRNPPGESQYERPPDFWYILMGRILFIVIYQNLVNGIKVLVEWMIPDVPKELNQRIKKEACLVSERMLDVVKQIQDPKSNTGHHEKFK